MPGFKWRIGSTYCSGQPRTETSSSGSAYSGTFRRRRGDAGSSLGDWLLALAQCRRGRSQSILKRHSVPELSASPTRATTGSPCLLIPPEPRLPGSASQWPRVLANDGLAAAPSPEAHLSGRFRPGFLCTASNSEHLKGKRETRTSLLTDSSETSMASVTVRISFPVSELSIAG